MTRHEVQKLAFHCSGGSMCAESTPEQGACQALEMSLAGLPMIE